MFNSPLYFRKSAMFEGLEVDQYLWSILQNKQTADFDEVTIDQNAKVKPCLPTIVKVTFLSVSLKSNTVPLH